MWKPSNAFRLPSATRVPGYKQSLDVLEHYLAESARAGQNAITKSSIMLGVGETEEEVRQTMRDLLDVGVSVLTLGQYLQPTPKHLEVEEFIHPDRFTAWAEEGEAMGFAYVASGPLVRSSYRAGEYYIRNVLEQEPLIRRHGIA